MELSLLEPAEPGVIHRPRALTMTRRDILKGLSLAVTGLGLIGCGTKGQGVPQRPLNLLFSFNRGDGTVTVIDGAASEPKVTQTVPFAPYGLYPSNQYSPGTGFVLLPQPGKVTIMRTADLSVAGTVDMTGATGIWADILPSGKAAIVVGRETDQIKWINLDPSAGGLGRVDFTLEVPGRVGICDESIDPAGRYAYIPDLYTNQLTVVDLHSRAIVFTGASQRPKPFMGTVSWDGKWWTVEHQGSPGGVSIYSLADPTRPVLAAFIDKTSGLGQGPHTDEFRPDSRYDFVIDKESADVTVIDMATLKVAATVNLPVGSGPTVGAFSYDGATLYVNLPGANAVAAIDTHAFKVIKLIPVGKEPIGIAPDRYSWVHHR